MSSTSSTCLNSLRLRQSITKTQTSISKICLRTSPTVQPIPLRSKPMPPVLQRSLHSQRLCQINCLLVLSELLLLHWKLFTFIDLHNGLSCQHFYLMVWALIKLSQVYFLFVEISEFYCSMQLYGIQHTEPITQALQIIGRDEEASWIIFTLHCERMNIKTVLCQT